MFGWVLWHINHFRLFNAKSSLSIYTLDIYGLVWLGFTAYQPLWFLLCQILFILIYIYVIFPYTCSCSIITIQWTNRRTQWQRRMKEDAFFFIINWPFNVSLFYFNLISTSLCPYINTMTIGSLPSLFNFDLLYHKLSLIYNKTFSIAYKHSSSFFFTKYPGFSSFFPNQPKLL